MNSGVKKNGVFTMNGSEMNRTNLNYRYQIFDAKMDDNVDRCNSSYGKAVTNLEMVSKSVKTNFVNATNQNNNISGEDDKKKKNVKVRYAGYINFTDKKLSEENPNKHYLDKIKSNGSLPSNHSGEQTKKKKRRRYKIRFFYDDRDGQQNITPEITFLDSDDKSTDIPADPEEIERLKPVLNSIVKEMIERYSNKQNGKPPWIEVKGRKYIDPQLDGDDCTKKNDVVKRIISKEKEIDRSQDKMNAGEFMEIRDKIELKNKAKLSQPQGLNQKNSKGHVSEKLNQPYQQVLDDEPVLLKEKQDTKINMKPKEKITPQLSQSSDSDVNYDAIEDFVETSDSSISEKESPEKENQKIKAKVFLNQNDLKRTPEFFSTPSLDDSLKPMPLKTPSLSSQTDKLDNKLNLSSRPSSISFSDNHPEQSAEQYKAQPENVVNNLRESVTHDNIMSDVEIFANNKDKPLPNLIMMEKDAENSKSLIKQGKEDLVNENSKSLSFTKQGKEDLVNENSKSHSLTKQGKEDLVNENSKSLSLTKQGKEGESKSKSQLPELREKSDLEEKNIVNRAEFSNEDFQKKSETLQTEDHLKNVEEMEDMNRQIIDSSDTLVKIPSQGVFGSDNALDVEDPSFKDKQMPSQSTHGESSKVNKKWSQNTHDSFKGKKSQPNDFVNADISANKTLENSRQYSVETSKRQDVMHTASYSDANKKENADEMVHSAVEEKVLSERISATNIKAVKEELDGEALETKLGDVLNKSENISLEFLNDECSLSEHDQELLNFLYDAVEDGIHDCFETIIDDFSFPYKETLAEKSIEKDLTYSSKVGLCPCGVNPIEGADYCSECTKLLKSAGVCLCDQSTQKLSDNLPNFCLTCKGITEVYDENKDINAPNTKSEILTHDSGQVNMSPQKMERLSLESNEERISHADTLAKKAQVCSEMSVLENSGSKTLPTTEKLTQENYQGISRKDQDSESGMNLIKAIKGDSHESRNVIQQKIQSTSEEVSYKSEIPELRCKSYRKLNPSDSSVVGQTPNLSERMQSHASETLSANQIKPRVPRQKQTSTHTPIPRPRSMSRNDLHGDKQVKYPENNPDQGTPQFKKKTHEVNYEMSKESPVMGDVGLRWWVGNKLRSESKTEKTRPKVTPRVTNVESRYLQPTMSTIQNMGPKHSIKELIYMGLRNVREEALILESKLSNMKS